MSARSYLSIGDVLTLLRQEFPDVTISKIRFLESQGLVNPERTPSGYRKFYEHDVERLRWVLRQQRENFLPLKVIKDRLDDEQADDASSVPADSPPAAAVGEPVLVGQRATGEQHAAPVQRAAPTRSARAGAVAPRPAVADRTGTGDEAAVDDGATLPGIEAEAPSPNGSSTGVGATGNGSTPMAGRRERDAAHRPVAASDGGPEPSTVPPPSRSGGLVAGRSGPTGPTSGPPPAADRSVAARTGDGRRGSPAGPAPATAGVAPAAQEGGPSGGRSSAALSIDEVAAGSGLEVAVVEELVAYGLLSCTSMAGLDCFDEGAVTVASLAAGFARYGIEPRHLRLYKNAADREAGFIEQIILPLLRQRNPEARVRANETADELARLGQQLRSSLVRNALGGLLDG